MKRAFFLGLIVGIIGVLAVGLGIDSLTSAQGSRTVVFHQGWNQLVWTGENAAIDTALVPPATHLSMLYGWQDDTQTFSRYVPGRPDVSSITQVEKDAAYWVLMAQDFTFPIPTSDVQCPQATMCPAATPCPGCGEWQTLAEDCVTDFGQCVADLSWSSSELSSCWSDLDNCGDDFPAASLCELLDDLDDLQWYNLSTAFAVDCGFALECELQCGLDFGFEQEVNAVSVFLQTSPSFDLSM